MQQPEVHIVAMIYIRNFAVLSLLVLMCLSDTVLSQRSPYVSRIKDIQIIPEGPAWPVRAEDYSQSVIQSTTTRSKTVFGDIGRESISDLSKLELGIANRKFYPTKPPALINLFEYGDREDDFDY